MDTSPQGSKLIFLGIAGIRSRRQESIGFALEEAARRVAIFHDVVGEFYFRSNTGSRLLDYRAETTSSLRYDEAYRDYVEALEFDEDFDVFESENAIFVRVRYPGRLSLNYYPSLPGPGGKPYWTENPPGAIGAYTAGVGYAGRRNAHRDTVIASWENAIFSVIRNVSAQSWGQSIDFRGGGFLDHGSSIEHGVEAKAVLKGFYVLETWTDPVNKSVWTLAIAQGSPLESLDSRAGEVNTEIEEIDVNETVTENQDPVTDEAVLENQEGDVNETTPINEDPNHQENVLDDNDFY